MLAVLGITAPIVATAVTVGTYAICFHRQDIKYIYDMAKEYTMALISSSLVIDKEENYRTTYAIINELDETYANKVKKMMVTDGGARPNYKLVSGHYYINFENQRYHVYVTDDKIEILGYFVNIETMKRILDEIYQKHNKTTNVLTFFLSADNIWTTPIFRRPRANMKMTADMNNMLADINKFYDIQTEEEYAKIGKPYRRGYFVHGPPGTGKTSILEKIAMCFDLGIYLINFNSTNMTDTNLINLVANVPMRSLIAIDEMDKQYDAIKQNKNVHISNGGMLTALDGPQRLSHGTIIVIIANDVANFDKNFYASLIRPGRIDAIFNFTELL
uniref:AAA+ ATPase domain-containing protein n=1 Tax=viral metagenome TaxID=1070528 RepID=A0A6C0C6D0_9ZZZZ